MIRIELEHLLSESSEEIEIKITMINQYYELQLDLDRTFHK